jgi:hypothetical protein
MDRKTMSTHLCLLACLTSLWAVPLSGQETRLPLPSPYVPGYARTLAGEELRYHSPLPDVDRSLLVRSVDRARGIAWETEPVPPSSADDTATFVIMAGIDVNDAPRRFDLFVNDDSVLAFHNPVRAAAGETLVWPGESGVRAEFRVVLIDKYGDAMGFIYLRVPRREWRGGRSLRLRVAGESAGEQTWFMVFKEPIAPRVTLRNAPALLRGERRNQQALRVDLLYLGDEGVVQMTGPIGRIDGALTLGHNRFVVPVPEVTRPMPVDLAFVVDGEEASTSFTVRPVRRMNVHLIHHTHLDIGYTHHQDEVERLQWHHLEDALRLGAASADYPEGARFIWNPEGLWAVESYLENHEVEENERLREGIRRGWIRLDALFANLLTGIASSEGLMHSLAAARRLEAWSGVPIESAMLSDIPGFTWGLVPVLAQHGIKYLSIGPNFGHRIGLFLDDLGDRPFYWASPSGDERILTWVSGAGYSMFHSGLGYSKITKALDEESVFKYVDQLEASGYPYDIVQLRYNIGSDNGPPDPNLANAVRAWNERYVSPRLVISDVARTFGEFEARYGAGLPVYRGDLTGYWEDGAASSARETALARQTAESLVQAEALAAMLGAAAPRDEVYEAWRNLLLFYEHTWGSWNSISEPESELTIGQWEQKKAFAQSAAERADRLIKLALVERWDASVPPRTIEVINTASWPRGDVVLLSPEMSRAGDRVREESGRVVPSQRLATGELAFRADSVPAFGARRFVISNDSVTGSNSAERRNNVIANRAYRVEVDTLRGTFSVFCPTLGRDLAAAGGLNEYVYVAGRDPTETLTAGRPYVRVSARGPVIWAIDVTRPAPGAEAGIRSEIRLYSGSERIDVINSIDKALTYEPEAVLYRFSFNLRDPQVRVDVPWGSYRPELDQLPGAAKNYLSLQRWVDIQGERSGITFVSIDAPLIQLGKIRTDAIVTGWLDHLAQSPTLFSYVMNNYWETNYRAGQEGLHHFRYSIRPRATFDEARAERFAIGLGQPLIAVPVKSDAPPLKPPIVVGAARAVVTLLKPAENGEGLVVRMYNPGSAPDTVAFTWPDGSPRTAHRSDVWERDLGALGDTVPLGAYEIATLRFPN